MNRPARYSREIEFFPSVARNEDENIRWKLFQRFAEIQKRKTIWKGRYSDVNKEQSSQAVMIITQCHVPYY